MWRFQQERNLSPKVVAQSPYFTEHMLIEHMLSETIVMNASQSQDQFEQALNLFAGIAVTNYAAALQ